MYRLKSPNQFKLSLIFSESAISLAIKLRHNVLASCAPESSLSEFLIVFVFSPTSDFDLQGHLDFEQHNI